MLLMSQRGHALADSHRALETKRVLVLEVTRELLGRLTANPRCEAFLAQPHWR